MSRGSGDWRVEWLLRAAAASLLVVIGLVFVTVFVEAWPSFAHNGLSWFLPGGEPDQQLKAMITGPQDPAHAIWTFNAWPLIWATLLTSGFAVLFAVPLAILAAVFIVEVAPAPIRRVAEPTIQLLAGVPSVVYGLVGVLLLSPWVEHTFISEGRKQSVGYVVQLTGNNLALATLILALMITPIMIALTVNALQTVPRAWTEGSSALGVNRWRTIRRVSLRAARPAITAAAVLATGRALGEAIMLNMVAGSRSFAPNPLDGATFFFEPVQPMAATIVRYLDAFSVQTVRHTLYAIGAVVLVSTVFLSLAGWAVKQPMKRYAAAS
jgi:phosphate ABC transporter permease protein PstC